MNDEAQALLQFWFGRAAESPQHAEEQSALWWKTTPEQDAEITQRFFGLHEQAAAGELEAWKEDAYGQLALILLLDQIPRSMFRKTARAFATDAMALEITQLGVRKAIDSNLNPVERIFYYLPMEHSETSVMQKMAILMLGSLRNEVLPDWKDYLQNAYHLAQHHQRIISLFGRFPYRNEVLGRESTPEELDWLENTSLRFGQ